MPPIDWLPYQRMAYYPHMAVADMEIWNRYITANPRQYKAVAYDVAVGEGADFDMTAGGIIGGNIKKLYQRRIDVLGLTALETELIELKPRASTAALGQIKGYLRLVARDFPELRGLRPVIITDVLVPEMEFLAKAENVEIRLI